MPSFTDIKRRLIHKRPMDINMSTTVRDELMPTVDIAVVGSGIAGLFLAHRCAQKGLSVALITKKSISTSNTNWAQGGIAGVLDPENEEAIEAHVADTLSAGAGLCNEKVVRSVVLEAADRIRDLVKHGVRFDKNESGDYDTVREGGHSDQRILHSKDATGAEIERALTKSTSGEIDENDSDSESGVINQYLSGFYVISGVEWLFTKPGPVRMRLTLQRREFTPTT